MNSHGTSHQDSAQIGNASRPLGLILALYLMGLLIGGLYVGMVSPVRTVIQEQFGINDVTGIWMINIYTLFYAALIPVIGKLADMFGRKRIFALCLAAFALGSLACGASSILVSFPLLLVGRVAQAVGACGMIPVANAEIGTTFPPEKRGMALGLAAAVAGIANVLGAGVGSAVLGLIGNTNWAWLFWGCVPICVVLAVAAAVLLPSHEVPVKGKLDLLGAVIFVLFVVALLMALRDVDVFHPESMLDPGFWGWLVVAAVCVVLFRLVEYRAENPIFHLEYLHNRSIVITCVVSFFIGCTIISMVLVPEFCEFVMGDPVGSGGYYVVAIGVFSLAGPMIAGKLIDRFGPKPILMAGLFVQMIGFVFLALVATAVPNALILIAGLCIVGLGMGFSMGAPTNYMILEQVDDAESTAAISTIALVRQIGTTLAPAILVGFISNNAGVMGYQKMMFCVAVFCVIAFVVMLAYHSPRK